MRHYTPRTFSVTSPSLLFARLLLRSSVLFHLTSFLQSPPSPGCSILLPRSERKIREDHYRLSSSVIPDASAVTPPLPLFPSCSCSHLSLPLLSHFLRVFPHLCSRGLPPSGTSLLRRKQQTHVEWGSGKQHVSGRRGGVRRCCTLTQIWYGCCSHLYHGTSKAGQLYRTCHM